MTLQHLNPDTVSRPSAYTHVVTATGGTIVFIAGQVAKNAAGDLIGPGDLRLQTEQAFENVKRCLAAVGATFDNVTKMTIFLFNSKLEDRPLLEEFRRRYLGDDKPPAVSQVGLQAPGTEFLIEIEATAVLP